MKTKILSTIVLSTAIFVLPLNILACACCSEKGFYSISTMKPDTYSEEILNSIKFTQKAELYSEGTGLEELLSNSNDDEQLIFGLENIFKTKTWNFSFKSSSGKSGKLTLPLPASMVSYKVDIHDGRTGSGGGPLLYKEWRFKGNVKTGSGFFKSGITNPTTYFLVLQGRGNACDNAEDFTHWTLEISGKRAEYRFIGTLLSGDPPEIEK